MRPGTAVDSVLPSVILYVTTGKMFDMTLFLVVPLPLVELGKPVTAMSVL